MIRINQIKLQINHSEKELVRAIRKSLKLKNDIKFNYSIVRKSIDARKQPVMYSYSVNVYIDNEDAIVKKVNNNNIMSTTEKRYTPEISGMDNLDKRPVVVGCGPAGLFCTYMLASYGYKPLMIERGENVEKRTKDVEEFWNNNVLNVNSNVQFGEGGAGTFSDGKLNTMVKDKFGRNRFVLETFVKFGAPESILYNNKPHIGTDILCMVVKNMRKEIIRLGGEVRFNTCLTDVEIKEDRLCSLTVNNSEKIGCDVLVLAPGHSARDTFNMLYRHNLTITPKSFAVGVRVMHNQNMIDISQYGEMNELLPSADYKVTANLDNGRGVYSFCMCPGGYVVNASSEEGMLAVNGMSYSKRDSGIANSAVIVTVTPDDFEGDSPLAGIEFQRKLEKAAYRCGHGKIPVQLYGDFKNKKVSEEFGEITPKIKGEYVFADINEIFPEYINESLVAGMERFGHKIDGFDRKDAIFAGVESRTSSPLRIVRNEEYESSVKGIYPCGEGAGYAGGITSAAMDGIKVFEAIALKYKPLLCENNL